jgi:hypothetical protein
MKTWTWVLLFVVALLFMWTAREGFQDTIALHGPPYGNCVLKADGTCNGSDDYTVISGMMPATLVIALEAANQATKPATLPLTASASERTRYASELRAYYKKLIDGKISDTMGEFFTKVYQPATNPLRGADVDTFLTTYIAQIQTTSPTVATFLTTNKTDIKALLVAYFVTQTAGAANAPLTAAQTASDEYSASTGYDAILASLGQGGATPPPKCPTGYTLSADYKKCTGASVLDTKTPVCDTGFTFADGKCTVGGAAASSDDSSNTTGGSQTFNTSNSGNSKGNLWGPAFTGMGNNAGIGGTSGGARDYPTLKGPTPKASTMVDGAGVITPSQHETLVTSGVLPGAAGTGSDPNSQFFGSSRVPGDKDLFPNPYQEFTASIGSSKTEPVPYLSDFSAFLR